MSDEGVTVAPAMDGEDAPAEDVQASALLPWGAWLRVHTALSTLPTWLLIQKLSKCLHDAVVPLTWYVEAFIVSRSSFYLLPAC